MQYRRRLRPPLHWIQTLGLVGFANRWTYSIGKDGMLLAIDKSIKPGTSAEDIAAKLWALGVEKV
ncbi:MAG: hypothetical protein ACRD09_02470 [Vicinamibacterales bacterium]